MAYSETLKPKIDPNDQPPPLHSHARRIPMTTNSKTTTEPIIGGGGAAGVEGEDGGPGASVSFSRYLIACSSSLAKQKNQNGLCTACYNWPCWQWQEHAYLGCVRYLYDVLSQMKRLDKVAFVDLVQIDSQGCGSAESRARHLKERMINGKPGQLFLLPYNSGDHWVLTVVDPEQGTVYYLDPMKRRLPAVGEWQPLLNSALEQYNAQKNKECKDPLWIPMMGIPKQHDHIQCGYYIMCYMRDIVLDKDLSWISKIP